MVKTATSRFTSIFRYFVDCFILSPPRYSTILSRVRKAPAFEKFHNFPVILRLMGKGTAAAVLDNCSVAPPDIIWRSQTVFIRIHRTETEKTVKHLFWHSLVTGKVLTALIFKILVAVFHNHTPLHIIFSSPPVSNEVNDRC